MRAVPLMPEMLTRIQTLANTPRHEWPRVILSKKAQIEAMTLAAEHEFARTRVPNEGLIHCIVVAKLELDALYMEWLEGRL